MTLVYFLKGILIGFAIAAPVGPIGILCIQRTLSLGTLTGLATGLGAATADGLYGAVAGFGLTSVSGFILSYQTWIRLLGGLFLCYLGVKTLRSKAAPLTTTVASSTVETSSASPVLRGNGILGSYTSTLFLTLTNPMTIISFAGIFAGIGFTGKPGSYMTSSALVTGVFLGSSLWWILLSFSVNTLSSKFNFSSLTWINRISGIIVLIFGFMALLSSL